MNSPANLPKPNRNYGGQAVIEGVMMRGRKAMAVAVRRPDGSIQSEVSPLNGIYRSPVVRIPILRGVLLLWDTFGLGYKSLSFSAQVQDEKPVGRFEWLSTILISLVIAFGFFFLVPIGIAQGAESLLHIPPLAGVITEGCIRLVLLLGYIAAIGLIPEIARVFAYHGAEHKTINAYEAGAELTPESVEGFPRENPRCGTSFLVVVAALAVFLFALFGPLPLGERILSRLIGIPLLIAIGYEYLRLSAFLQGRTLSKILSAPGMWAQKFTTREPDRSMLEVAIAAFQEMRQAEENDPWGN
jgi:uncharacterized protein YqhQ